MPSTEVPRYTASSQHTEPPMPYHRFQFNKLVRDNVPTTQRAEGCRPEYHHIRGDTLLKALAAKLVEEATETQQAL
ncbi:MAG: hypothetical protein EBS53_12050 [Bacteroidetes bacterium]|nr:hypothetical protein [Bacteroidota bacterium]